MSVHAVGANTTSDNALDLYQRLDMNIKKLEAYIGNTEFPAYEITLDNSIDNVVRFYESIRNLFSIEVNNTQPNSVNSCESNEKEVKKV